MSYKLFILTVALAYGAAAAAAAAAVRHHPHHGQKISKQSGDALIQSACGGKGIENATECVSTLQTARPDQKADAHALALFTIGFVDKHAENVTDGIKKINAMPDVAPLLQAALSDCTEQYTSLDDLIEDATQAIQSKNYPDAERFLMASIDSVHECDARLKDSNFEEKVEKKTGPDYEMATGLYKYNILHRELLFAALNIISVD